MNTNYQKYRKALLEEILSLNTANMTPQEIKESVGYQATRNALIKYLHKEGIPFKDPRSGKKPRPGSARDKLSAIDTSNMTIGELHSFLGGKVKLQSLRMICLHYEIPYKKEANRV
ncbi:DUF4224 domain-containing protein [Burkholderia multivorans]|uniref:DUF4224 domain-containing protein n=1 Tax=Burkholderia multivorans TaxID=87883 RepID=UPI001C2339DF|nr:DUF4224 domain-containing protein [Burkholderia multivorans]MBU9118398.1 DUF4224 domain-containing protein [Burkholderia multivorans]